MSAFRPLRDFRLSNFLGISTTVSIFGELLQSIPRISNYGCEPRLLSHNSTRDTASRPILVAKALPDSISHSLVCT